MGAVMGFSVRSGDESRTILRELAAGLLNSLQARVPCCSRKMGCDDIVINEAHREWNFPRASTTPSIKDRRTT